MAAPKSRMYTIIAIGVFAVLSVAVVLTAITFTRNNITSRRTYSDEGQRVKRSCPLSAQTLREVMAHICDGRQDLLLNVTYGKEQFVCGQPSTTEKTAAMPNVKLRHADKNAQYTMVMLDPNAPGHSAESLNFYLHWANVNVIGSPKQKDTSKAKTLMGYAGPSPPKGTGLHVYQMIVFESTEQGGNIKLYHDMTSRTHFMLHDFVEKNHLCNIVGLFEFTVVAGK